MNEEDKQPAPSPEKVDANADAPASLIEDLTGAESIETPDFNTPSRPDQPVDESSYWEAMAEEENTSTGINQAVLTALEEENRLLRGQLEERNQQIESLKSTYARLNADFDNFRKRTAKEKEELDIQIKGNTIKELLPVIDNFDRARTHIKPQGEGEMNIHKSYQNLYKQLVDCLKRIGVSPMRPEGEQFDPNFHEALMREPSSEHPEGAVIEQLVRGYMLGERVLRHAQVKVAAAPEEGIPEEEASSETVSNETADEVG